MRRGELTPPNWLSVELYEESQLEWTFVQPDVGQLITGIKSSTHCRANSLQISSYKSLKSSAFTEFTEGSICKAINKVSNKDSVGVDGVKMKVTVSRATYLLWN